MNHHRRLWAIGGSGLIFMALTAFWIHYQYTKYERAYALLVPGTTKSEVIKQFGKPDAIEACHRVPLWDDEHLVKESKCVVEFRYFSRMRIGAWIIGFDANERAVTKYYESSP